MSLETPLIDPLNIRLVKKVLPSESLFSILTIIGWQYALPAHELFRLVSSKKSFSRAFGFLKKDWIDDSKIYTNFGIESNKSGEFNTLASMQECSKYWFSQQLRICPVCLESGYHSYWFQLNDLICCPIHGCLLHSQCNSCGVLLPSYSFSKELFRDPFFCSSCGGPISGAAPNFVEIEEFRSHRADIEFRFSEFEKWSKGFGDMSCFHKFARISCNNSLFWISNDYLNRQVGRYYHPVPASVIVQSSGLCFDLVCWRVQMLDIQGYNNSGSVNYDRYNNVWRVFMRRIRYWIFGGMGSARLGELYRKYQIIDRDAVDLSNWNVLEFSLMLFRDMLGIWWTNTKRETTDTALARFPNGVSLWKKRLPRVGLLYLLLANFSGLVVMIDRLSKERKKFKLSAIRAMENKWAVSTFDYSPSGLATGVLALPVIVGFPVRWSDKIKNDLSTRRGLDMS